MASASPRPFVADRAVGLLVGLCVGDTNGGPLQMALALAEVLASDAGVYRPDHVLAAYLRWWDCGRGTDAWDTGPTTESVFMACAPSAASGLALLELAIGKARALNERLRGRTAGVNAMHRCAPLALLHSLSDSGLQAAAARQESQLTHFSPISQHACALFVCLCRLLVEGHDWEASVREVLLQSEVLCPDTPAVAAAVAQGMDPACSTAALSSGGYCIDALKAAVFFVNASVSFHTALAPALAFAGPDNYCPVIVGALAGARYGASSVLPHVAASDTDQLSTIVRATAAAEALAGLAK